VRPASLSSVPTETVQKILILGDHNELASIEDELSKIDGAISWFRSEPTYLEIGRADTSKATGVRVVMGWLKPSRTYAIGDGISDIPMFGVVDVAVAVANAPAMVRDQAEVVVAANDCEGVAVALESIMDGCL
jgi:hydroxymethylpyrimidine pyrophosphatase-like HAD family hydrolase